MLLNCVLCVNVWVSVLAKGHVEDSLLQCMCCCCDGYYWEFRVMMPYLLGLGLWPWPLSYTGVP